MTKAQAEAAPKQVQVQNLTRGQTLVTAGRVADNAWTRFRGLIGQPPLAPGEGLLIVPCSSIHTHLMGFAIDVVYVNAALEVVGIDRNLKPWRFGRLYRRVRLVIELPPGTASQTGTQAGDQLQVLGYEL